jgi:hypothetical protein
LNETFEADFELDVEPSKYLHILSGALCSEELALSLSKRPVHFACITRTLAYEIAAG